MRTRKPREFLKFDPRSGSAGTFTIEVVYETPFFQALIHVNPWDAFLTPMIEKWDSISGRPQTQGRPQPQDVVDGFRNVIEDCVRNKVE